MAQQLGNTASACRKSYIHPEVISAYLDGTLIDTLLQQAAAALADDGGLDQHEQVALAFLAQRLRQAGA